MQIVNNRTTGIGFFKTLWWIVGVFALLTFIFTLFYAIGLVRSHERELTYVGIYTFKTTGELELRQERKTERINYKHSKSVAVTNYYAVYMSEDKQYRFERRLDPSNITMIRNIRTKRAVYKLERDVWQDKYGKVEFKQPGYQAQTLKELISHYVIAFGIMLLSALLMFLSIKKIRFG